jgi:predicted DNA-binding transcriptional regulator YafY
LDWTYLLLEWLVVNALRKGGDRRRPQSTRPEPLYPEAERLEVLRCALEFGSDVQIVYFAASSGRETERVVTPQALWQAQAGQWLLTARDHLRGDRRTFRVNRIRELTAAPAPPDLSMMKC